MFRHMYEGLRKEQQEGRGPQWLQMLRKKQTIAAQIEAGGTESPAPSSARVAMKSRGPPSSAASPSARESKATAAADPKKVKYDPSTGLATRFIQRSTKGKLADPTDDIFEPEDARGHNFMMARWPDGWSCELETLTVSAWRGQQKAKERKGNANILWQTEVAKNKYSAELKLLDRDNPGVVVKVNGGQKCQLAFKIVDEKAAIEHAVKWAKEMAKKQMTGEDAAAWAKEKKRALEAGHGGAAKKPAAALGKTNRADAAAEEDDEEEGDAEEEEEDEDDTGDGAEEEDAEEETKTHDDVVDADGDEDVKMKKPAAATAPSPSRKRPAAAAAPSPEETPEGEGEEEQAPARKRPAAKMKPAAVAVVQAPVRRRPSVATPSDAESSVPEQITPPPMQTLASLSVSGGGQPSAA